MACWQLDCDAGVPRLSILKSSHGIVLLRFQVLHADLPLKLIVFNSFALVLLERLVSELESLLG